MKAANSRCQRGDDWQVRGSTATYHAALMVNRDWVGPPGEPHALFPVAVEGGRKFGLDRVSAFALRLPDGSWSLLVLNKDPIDSYQLRVDFRSGADLTPARGPVAVTQFSSAQYRWHPARDRGQAKVNRGPETRTEPDLPITLPPYSVNIVRLAAPDHRNEEISSASERK